MDHNQILQLFPIPSPSRVSPLVGGANNRVYKLEFEAHPPLVLKQYFQDPTDPRPRLQSEFSFLTYAWNMGIRAIPKPYFASTPANAAVYSYIPALSIQPQDVNDDLVEQKMTFFLRLNENKNKGLHLSKASEACFSSREFLEVTENRIARLHQYLPVTPLEKEVKSFVSREISPKWTQLQTQCKAALHSLGEFSLSIENQCISPSDFGFHNALLQDKRLIFIDFEYAGWDDPCKTVCDLFCQPKIPLPMRYFQKILKTFSLCITDPENFLKRVELFFPVIQMKWCCIILSAFTKAGKERRTFSQSDEVEHLEGQLALAKERLQQITI